VLTPRHSTAQSIASYHQVPKITLKRHQQQISLLQRRYTKHTTRVWHVNQLRCLVVVAVQEMASSTFHQHRHMWRSLRAPCRCGSTQMQSDSACTRSYAPTSQVRLMQHPPSVRASTLLQRLHCGTLQQLMFARCLQHLHKHDQVTAFSSVWDQVVLSLATWLYTK
jgi:hypothetical protein